MEFQSTLDFRHKLDDLDAHICALPEELKRVGLDQRAASSEVQKEEAKSTCAQEREVRIRLHKTFPMHIYRAPVIPDGSICKASCCITTDLRTR